MYYAFEYADGKNTTTGRPNRDPGRYRGRLSIAGQAMVFHTKQKRDEWVQSGGKSHGGRESVSIRRLRYLCRGMTAAEFTEYLDMLKWGILNL
jgi:hypothetical protein